MKLVLFNLADQTFAADVRQVKEVIRIEQVVPIPDCPAWVEGIIHLRGEVLPLISLACKLHLPEEAQGAHNRVIVSRRAKGNLGVIVDDVKGVVNVDPSVVTVPDDIVGQATAMAAVSRINDELIPILDLDALISDQESAAMAGELANVADELTACMGLLDRPLVRRTATPTSRRQETKR